MQGPRSENQDRGLALHVQWGSSELALLGVCDGVGGALHGGRAAAEVIGWLPGILPLLPPEPALLEAARAVAAWTRLLDDRLAAVGMMGLSTTLVAALAWGERILVWWLGDSRAYLFRGGRLRRLTMDHSVVEEILALDEEEALVHEDRHKITRLVRGGNPQDPAVVDTDWQPGDVLLLCSDGICGAMRTAELETFLAYWLAADVTPEELNDRLLDHLSQVLTDNATVAVAMYGQPRTFAQAAVLDIPVIARRGLADGPLQILVDGLRERDQTRVAGELEARPTPYAIGPDGGIVNLAWEGDELRLDPETLPDDPTVSAGHARLVRENGSIRLVDGNSDNGLWLQVSDHRAEGPVTVRVGRYQVCL